MDNFSFRLKDGVIKRNGIGFAAEAFEGNDDAHDLMKADHRLSTMAIVREDVASEKLKKQARQHQETLPNSNDKSRAEGGN